MDSNSSPGKGVDMATDRIETSIVALPHGINLSVRSCGAAGRPVLMFLHGFPEAAFIWDELLLHFAKPENGGYRCIAPNLRGFEKSSSPVEPEQYRAKHLVQDIAALIALQGGQLAALVAHDWGGAVAWNLAAAMPQLINQLVIINSPHPRTFLRELQNNAAQQEASAYMNFLCRSDAPALLAENDFARLWPFFTNFAAQGTPQTWLTEDVREQYREVWRQGLHGGCNYYRASPLRPASAADRAASAIQFPSGMFSVQLPTLVIWGMDDIALQPGLLDGLEQDIAELTVERVQGASHWIVHEKPQWVMQRIGQFLLQKT
jgi:epoxide hydrolase 4